MFSQIRRKIYGFPAFPAKLWRKAPYPVFPARVDALSHGFFVEAWKKCCCSAKMTPRNHRYEDIIEFLACKWQLNGVSNQRIVAWSVWRHKKSYAVQATKTVSYVKLSSLFLVQCTFVFHSYYRYEKCFSPSHMTSTIIVHDCMQDTASISTAHHSNICLHSE